MRQWKAMLHAMRPPPFRRRAVMELGPAWAGNSVNCAPFRIDAVTTREGFRFAALFDEAGDVVVVRHDLADGSSKRLSIPNERKPYDAHRAISLGVDRHGLVHLAFGAHTSSLQVTRARDSSLDGGFEDLGERHHDATYPMFLNLRDGRLAMLYRSGRADDGAIHVEYLADDGRTWSPRDKPLLSGAGAPYTCGPYLNTPLVGSDGRIYLFVVWRLRRKALRSDSIVNIGIDCLASGDGLASLATIQGVPLPETVTPLTSERAVAVPLDTALMNQGAAALLRDDRPAVLSYWAEKSGAPQFRLAWRASKRWNVAQVSNFKTNFRLLGAGTLPLPHSRPELLACDDGRIVVLYRSQEAQNRLMATVLSPPHYRLASAREQILVDEDLGFCEPILDRAAWHQRRELVLYVQHCRQGFGRDEMPDMSAAEARLVTWTLD